MRIRLYFCEKNLVTFKKKNMSNVDFDQIPSRDHMANIEKRVYDENSTPEEIEMLKKCVYVYEDNIIFYDEINIVCPFSINLFFQKTEELAEQFDSCGLVINISNTLHPDASTRQAINQRFTKICNKVSHVAFITGKNFLLNTTIRFVLYGTDLNSVSVHKNQMEAISYIKQFLK